MKSEAFIVNDQELAKINETLVCQPVVGHKKIGIFLPTGAGDIMTAMSVLKYKDELWPDSDIIWFCNLPNADVFRYSMVSEVRTYAWEGMSVDPFTQLRSSGNRLRQDRKHEFEWSADLDDAYFPAPWMYSPAERHRIELPNISKKCFGVDPFKAWHPCLRFSQDELFMVRDLCGSLPYKKTIMLETDFNSGQSGWDDNLTRIAMAVCRSELGDCNFIFATNRDNTRFFDRDGVISCEKLTIRQTALLTEYCDLFIGVSSGVSVAVNAWGLKPIPQIQYCNSRICSTMAMANGNIELIVPLGALNKMEDINAKNSILKVTFIEKLINLLNKIK